MTRREELRVVLKEFYDWMVELDKEDKLKDMPYSVIDHDFEEDCVKYMNYVIRLLCITRVDPEGGSAHIFDKVFHELSGFLRPTILKWDNDPYEMKDLIERIKDSEEPAFPYVSPNE